MSTEHPRYTDKYSEQFSTEPPPKKEPRPLKNCPHCGYRHACENFLANQAGFCPIDGPMADDFGTFKEQESYVIRSISMTTEPITPEDAEPKKEVGSDTESSLNRSIHLLGRLSADGGYRASGLIPAPVEIPDGETVRFPENQISLDEVFDFEKTPTVDTFLKKLRTIGKTGQAVILDSATNYGPAANREMKYSEQGMTYATIKPVSEISNTLDSVWGALSTIISRGRFTGRQIAIVLSERFPQGRMIAQTDQIAMNGREQGVKNPEKVYNFIDRFIKLIDREAKVK